MVLASFDLNRFVVSKQHFLGGHHDPECLIDRPLRHSGRCFLQKHMPDSLVYPKLIENTNTYAHRCFQILILSQTIDHLWIWVYFVFLHELTDDGCVCVKTVFHLTCFEQISYKQKYFEGDHHDPEYFIRHLGGTPGCNQGKQNYP